MGQRLGQLGNAQPRAAIPTKIRRIRRFCVNIEANGGRRCRYPKSSHYPSDLIDPWQMDKYAQMQKRRSADSYAYALHHISPQVLLPGQDFGLSGRGIRIPFGLNQCNAIQQEAKFEQHQQSEANAAQPVSDADDNLQSTWTAAQQDSGEEPRQSSGGAATLRLNYAENTASDVPEPSDRSKRQLNGLADLIRESMYKLDSFLALQAQQQAQNARLNMNGSYFDLSQLPQFMDPSLEEGLVNKLKQGKTRGKRVVKVMPLQPLVFVTPPAAATPAPPPPTAAAAAATPTKSEGPKYRTCMRKKRPTAAKPKKVSSTEDSSTSKNTSSGLKKEQAVGPAQNMRDCGTTMWCPMACCKGFCGVVTERAESVGKRCRVSKKRRTGGLSIPVQLYMIPPQAPSTRQRNETDVDYAAIRYSLNAGQERHQGGKLSYSYIEEEEEERPQERQLLLEPDLESETETEMELEQSCSDEWYKSANSSQTSLEEQESYFSRMRQGSTCHKQLQADASNHSTDSCIADTRFIATANKSVCTRDMDQELATARNPNKIVRIYKTSALKSHRVKKNTTHKNNAKVKFVQMQTEQLSRRNSNSSCYLEQSSEPPSKFRGLQRINAGTESSQLLDQVTSSSEPDEDEFRPRSYQMQAGGGGYPTRWTQ